MMKKLAITAVLLLAAGPALAVGPHGPLPPPAQACLGPAFFFNPHCGGYTPPSSPPPSSPPSSSSSQGQGNGGHGNAHRLKTGLYLWGLCALISQGIDTFIVHEIRKSRRNRADELAAFACMPGAGPWFQAMFWKGRTPPLLPFYAQVNTKPAGVP